MHFSGKNHLVRKICPAVVGRQNGQCRELHRTLKWVTFGLAIGRRFTSILVVPAPSNHLQIQASAEEVAPALVYVYETAGQEAMWWQEKDIGAHAPSLNFPMKSKHLLCLTTDIL